MRLLGYTDGIAVLQGRVFEFSVESPAEGEHGVIWLEDRDSREQWECIVDDYAKFTRDGEILPVGDVLRYVACWLEASRSISLGNDEPQVALRDVFGDKYLIVPVRIRIRIHHDAVEVRNLTYTFPLKSMWTRARDPQQQEQQEQQHAYPTEMLSKRTVDLHSEWQDFAVQD